MSRGTNNHDLEKLYSEYLSHYERKEYDKALTKITKILQADKNNIQARHAKASILIESWDDSIKTKSQIFEAISHLDIVMKNNPENKSMYLINKGNAFYDLAISEFKKSSVKLDPEIINNLEQAKSCFQESLEIIENQPDVWINKGNSLDYLGRYLEAIECYDKAILLDNKHYNAWGNRGQSCWRLSELIEHKGERAKLFSEAMIYLAIELEMYPDFEIDVTSKERVRDFINKNKIQIDMEAVLKEQMPKKRALLGESFNLDLESEVDFKTFYYDFCEKHALFLNVHFDCNKCGCSTLDLIQVGFLTPINEFKRPYELFKKWFALVDDYKTSRSLLALSQFRPKELLFLDKQRYEPDYSLNYLFNVELLKNAFLTAMNIYDKIAFFLNDYEELELSDKLISFWGSNSIFNKTDILEKNEWQTDLVALDSIRKDLGKQEFKRIRLVRDYLVHRYFVLHGIVDVENLTYPYDSSETPLEHKEYHMDINEFFNLTIRTLRNIRNVLFSLAFFVSQKEKSKEKEVDGKIGEIPWTHDWEKDDELTKLADKYAKELKKSLS
ncbi:Tetratricopeptide (TPR) repeat [Candidatus Methanophagaceae archaeon]|nr:Tetratricopeptide (TPR) repeat [Methanophagales archaeon]